METLTLQLRRLCAPFMKNTKIASIISFIMNGKSR